MVFFFLCFQDGLDIGNFKFADFPDGKQGNIVSENK